MDVYFATNRNPNRQDDPISFGIDFHPRRHEFRVGTATVQKQGRQWKFQDLKAEPETPPSATGRLAGQTGFSAIGSPKLLETIQGDPRTGDLFVFIHGAGNSFIDAVETAALCAELYSQSDRQVVPLVFSYPANGSADPLNYFFDVMDADASGFAMARAFARFTRLIQELNRDAQRSSAVQPCKRRVHLLAHSLGNRALQAAIQVISQFPNIFPKTSLFHTTFLCNADVDADALTSADELRPLASFTKQIIVHFDTGDKLVDLSDAVPFREKRLGQIGPMTLPDPPKIDGCPITVLDLSDTQFGVQPDAQRHRHYKGSQVVIDDIKAVMAGASPTRKPHPEQRPGFFKL